MLEAMFQTGREQPFAVAYLYGIFPLAYHEHVSDDVADKVRAVDEEARARLRNGIQAAIDAGLLHDDLEQLTELCLLGAFGCVGTSLHDDGVIEPTSFADYTLAVLRSVT